MLTKGIWKDLLGKKSGYHYGHTPYKSKEQELREVSWLLIFTTLLTPISFILDILFLPIEILYYISKKFIERE